MDLTILAKSVIEYIKRLTGILGRRNYQLTGNSGGLITNKKSVNIIGDIAKRERQMSNPADYIYRYALDKDLLCWLFFGWEVAADAGHSYCFEPVWFVRKRKNG